MTALQPGAPPHPRKRAKRRGHADPVTQELADYLWQRDGRCALAKIHPGHTCDGPSEIDHILNSGKGKRGPSIPTNTVRLCQWAHATKTAHARAYRAILLAYVDRVERERAA